MTQPEPDRLLRDAEQYLSALHGSVARHDNLAANLGCAGCELRDRIGAVLRAAPAGQAPTTDGDAVRCPFCPDRALTSPSDAREHYTQAHPEQELAGEGPWPLLRVAPVTDQAALRDRIAEALLDHLSRTADIRRDTEGELAFMPVVTDEERMRLTDAVLSALPAHRRDIKEVMGPADGQQKMRLLADFHANATPVTEPADRATVLREAAAKLPAYLGTQGEGTDGEMHDTTLLWVADLLRRMADETQPERIALTHDQLAALLAHHADVLAAQLRTEPARDGWIAAERLDAHATALTDDEEPPAVAELLDAIWTFPVEQPEVVHGCPPDGSGLTPCCGRTPFELPRTDRISSETPITCTGPAVGARQPKETDSPRTVCVCGHTRGEHLAMSGRLLCDECDPDSTDNLVCKEFEAL